MDILFCDRCHESIPDADLETGKAVRVGGRVLHVACALRRAMPGPGRAFVAVLAVLAVAGAAYAVAKVETDSGPAVLPAKMPADWLASVSSESSRQVAQELDKALAKNREDIKEDLRATVEQKSREIETNLASHQREAIAKLDGEVRGFTEAQLHRFESQEKRLSELSQWVKEVRDLSQRTAGAGGGAATVPPTPPAPTNEGPTPPPNPPVAGPPTLDPEAQRRHDQELEEWIKKLKDPVNGIAFTATYKLKDLKDLRAVPALVDTLKSHKDYYTRLGAAVALGELKACDGVVPLLDAFDDKEDLVQQAAAEAFTTITGFDPKFAVASTRKERRAVRDLSSKWWREHETEVRARLNQPAPAPK
jgi:hypothetical protein